MNQKIIEVNLRAINNDADILEFEFNEISLQVNLNSSECQKELKTVFVQILKELLTSDIILNLRYNEDYKRKMYIDVCEEYIKDLNKEIENCKCKIRDKIKWFEGILPDITKNIYLHIFAISVMLAL